MKASEAADCDGMQERIARLDGKVSEAQRNLRVIENVIDLLLSTGEKIGGEHREDLFLIQRLLNTVRVTVLHDIPF